MNQNYNVHKKRKMCINYQHIEYQYKKIINSKKQRNQQTKKKHIGKRKQLNLHVMGRNFYTS